MNAKYNRWLEETAADQARRRVVIADYTKRRAILFCCALFITGCAFVMFFTTTRSAFSPFLESLAACLSWLVVYRVSSTLRTLQLLEHFSQQKEKPAA